MIVLLLGCGDDAPATTDAGTTGVTTTDGSTFDTDDRLLTLPWVGQLDVHIDVVSRAWRVKVGVER